MIHMQYNLPFMVYNSVAFSILARLYNHHQYLIPEYFHHPKKKSNLISSPVPTYSFLATGNH